MARLRRIKSGSHNPIDSFVSWELHDLQISEHNERVKVMKYLDRIWLSLLLLFPLLLMAGSLQLGSGETLVNVLESSAEQTILHFQIGSFESESVEIDNETWQHLILEKEGVLQLEGYPALPVVNRSIIIDGRAQMHLELYDVIYEDLQLKVAPSKGVIPRNIDPKTVPYRFADVYEKDEFYPREIATLSEPYILRDYRGITVNATPFAYNPVSQTLRIFKSFKLRIYAEGESQVNTLDASRSSFSRDFEQVYAQHFINWPSHRYTPVNDSFGKLLVICHSSFMDAIQPYVNWKKQKGIETELINFSTIGSTAAQLQSYIQNRYNADNSIAYVQIVGDAPQIPTLTHQSGGSDPTFSLVAGSDNYPDIFIGRFSAQSVADVNAQVNKTIAYERDATTADNWLSRAMGIASSEGSSSADNGETDIQHMNVIRTKLLNYGYTSVDQVYDPNASASTVTNNVNAGRGLINYVGHGGDTSWVTTGFNNTNASNLTNGTKTPVIMDVACVNGNFVAKTCFAEAWQRNANGGSVTIYASSINQSWASPMRAQDEFNDLLVGEQKFTAGGLYYNASCKMMDVYGTDGVNMFKTWHIFGDAALLVRSKTPTAMNVTHPNSIVQGTTSLTVNTGVANALVALTNNNNILGRGYTNSAGTVTLSLSGMPEGSATYTLTVTAHNRVTYIATVTQVPPSGPWIDVEEATWQDNNNDEPEFGESGALSLKLKNSGSEPSAALTLTLSCSTTGVTLTNNTHQTDAIAAGVTVDIHSAFGIQLADNLLDGTELNFSLSITSGTQSWTHEFVLIAKAPALALGDILVNDSTGNNSGTLDPGENVNLIITILNNGAAASPAGSVSLSSPTTGITIGTSSIDIQSIAAGASIQVSFPVSVSASMPQGSSASFDVMAITGAYYVAQTFLLQVGDPIAVTIGNGTDTQSYPLNRYYSYSAHEAIYLSSEIGMAGRIEKIAFYKSSGSDTNPIEAVQIYMKHTSSSTQDNGTYSTAGYTLVFSGSYPNHSTSGWMEVPLSSQFEYNGTSNLSILIVKGYQYWTSAYPRWTYTSASTYRVRRAQNDYGAPTNLSRSYDLPNIRLKIYPQMSGPAISSNPTSISATVHEDESGSSTLILSNSGDLPLTWNTNASFATWGNVSPTSGTIPTGGSVTLTVSYNAASLSVGTHHASIQINSDATNQNPYNIPVSLQVLASPYPPSPRLVAEWEPAKGVLVRYPLGLPYNLLADISQHGKLYVIVSSSDQSSCHSNLSSNGVNMSNVIYINASTNSVWVRDYAPWFVFDDQRELRVVDFKYNRPRPSDNNVPSVIADALGYEYHYLPLVATGGNMMTDGQGKMMSTTLVLEENDGNPNTGGGQVTEYTYTQAEIETLVEDYLGVSEYQFYQDPNGTYIDHIDCWAKLLDVDKVMIRSVPSSHAQYSAIEASVAEWQSKTSSYGTPYRIYRVNTPNDEPYSNSLIFNNYIYVPLMGNANDAAALQAYRDDMPGYTVSGYSYSAFQGTDALHCRTNTIFDEGMIQIIHTPVTTAMASSPLEINFSLSHVDAIDLNGSYVAYKSATDATWQYATLSSLGNDDWTAEVIAPAFGEEMQYYIYVQDSSGRQSQMPLCGPSDPFSFVIDQALPVAPIVNIQIVSEAAYLSWEAVPGAAYYKVYKASYPYGEYEFIGQTIDTSFDITPLADKAFFKVVSGF